MKVFDLSKMKAFPYEDRGKNIFYQAEGFKTRLIELRSGEEMPLCKMSEHVIFIVLEGEVTVNVNSEQMNLREKHCLITEPATLSMRTEKGLVSALAHVSPKIKKWRSQTEQQADEG
ncbi:MAG TPA: hypothetical protein VFG01_05260 [Acidobacteriota bacterium]|nr:hypothetical protein [Acidobacteriota bacterium]